MRVIKFVAKKDQKLSEAICDNYNFSNYNFVQKLFRNRDVKVNGKRTNKDDFVLKGTQIEFYFVDYIKFVEVLYDDQNIVIAFKPRQIETVSIDKLNNTFINLLENQLNTKLYAVHRLDRNTEGLIIFAKTLEAKNSLDNAIKNKSIKKSYLALVSGNPKMKGEVYEAYLKKDSANSIVKIFSNHVDGSVKILTKLSTIQSLDNCSLVKVDLLTGKTHQIRAHLSYLGYPIIGDQKYGNTLVNKTFKKHYQCLCAYKLKLNFSNGDKLSYLNEKTFEVDKSKIDFCKNL